MLFQSAMFGGEGGGGVLQFPEFYLVFPINIVHVCMLIL